METLNTIGAVVNYFATVLFINLNNVKILMKTIKDQLCNIVGVMIKEGLYEQIINEEILENLNELDKERYLIMKGQTYQK